MALRNVETKKRMLHTQNKQIRRSSVSGGIPPGSTPGQTDGQMPKASGRVIMPEGKGKSQTKDGNPKSGKRLASGKVLHTEPDIDTSTGKKGGIPKDAIGIIEIPSLDIRYPIYEGATEAQLSRGIVHLPETAGLLEQGNCVLCGHNGSSRGLFFTTLSHIRKDAQVKITTKDKRSRIYCVKSTRVVSPHDSSVRKKRDEEVLTLFTCAYHGTRRFVATCVPYIETQTTAPSETS